MSCSTFLLLLLLLIFHKGQLGLGIYAGPLLLSLLLFNCIPLGLLYSPTLQKSIHNSLHQWDCHL